jgi:hypothetical protein
VESSGSPGDSEEEIAGMDGAYRNFADQTLIDVEGIQLIGENPGRIGGECRGRRLASGEPVSVEPGPAQLTIRNLTGGELGVGLARFGDPPGIQVGSIFPGSRAWLSFEADDANRPWQVTTTGPARIRICG